MNKLILYLPTRGRVERQHTLKNLPKPWLARTIIVCPKDEVKQHASNFRGLLGIVPEPRPMTLAEKRVFIFKRCEKVGHEKIMQLDDDLRFSLRRVMPAKLAGFSSPEKNELWDALREKHAEIHKVVMAGPGDKRLSRMFERIEWMLGTYRHGGIAPRLMNQVHGCEFTINTRVMCCLAYHVPTVMENCNLGQIECRQDFDYILQMMRKGFPNAVYSWAVSEQQGGFGNKGGVSLYRTVAKANADARKLARLHPGLVKVVEKTFKNDTRGMGKRLEVIVSWAKAVDEGCAYKMGLL